SHEAAWDVMYKLAKEENGEMVLMVLGPMTNVAIAILKYPDMKKYIKRIYMMGGSRSYGNHSQNAEFNIWGDPHACQVVLSSGIPITMADLIFGEDYPLNGKQLKRAYGGAKRLKGLMDALWAHEMSWIERAKERTGEDFDVDTFEFHIYDTTAAAALLLEDCLVTEDYYVVCETQGSETQGQTVFDYKGYSGKAPNVSLATQMDLGRYIQLLTDAIAHFE
ncbi:MAG: nucleoside hydrolase, partial [Oscillospiraceae bacterium]